MNTIANNRKFSFGRMLLIGIAAGLPFAAQAGESDSQSARSLYVSSSIVVDYSDLDLNNPAGAHTLYARLKGAAKKVCGHRPPPLELRTSKEYRACFDDAMNSAVKRVNSQQLYALHAERGRQTTVG